MSLTRFSIKLFIALAVAAGLVLAVSYVSGQLVSEDDSFRSFGAVSVKPDIFLDGEGKNIDAPEFWKQPGSEKISLFVTGKKNRTIEQWESSASQWRQVAPIKRISRPNGLVIDEEKKWLLVGDSRKKLVAVFSLPELTFLKNIGDGVIRSGETNLDILTRSDGRKIVVVSESKRVLGFDLENGEHVLTIVPRVEGIEEVLADSYHKVIYVPEENGGKSKFHSGGAILAFQEDGMPFVKNGTNVFGQRKFSGDEEGITLFRCLLNGKDSGRGFIIVANQAKKEKNSFEIFDRSDWRHLGTFSLEGVSGTDGIDVMEQQSPDSRGSLFAATNADKDVAIVDFEKILTATGLACSE